MFKLKNGIVPAYLLYYSFSGNALCHIDHNPLLPKKALTLLSWKQEKPITGVLVDAQSLNHFAMDHIKVQALSPLK